MRGISLGIGAISGDDGADALRALLSEIRGWGYDAVEPLIGMVEPATLASLAGALEEAGLGLSGFRTGLIYRRQGWSFSDPDESVRRSAVEAVKAVVCAAGAFPGAKVLNGLIQGIPKPGVDIGQAREWVLECLGECAAEGERAGVELCLEPLNRHELPYHNTLTEVADLIRRIGSRHLTILIDTFHMNIEEEDITGAIAEHASLIGAVHFMDDTRREPGTGHLDLHAIYRALVEAGYDGYLTVEMDAHPRFHEAARSSALFLRELVDRG